MVVAEIARFKDASTILENSIDFFNAISSYLKMIVPLVRYLPNHEPSTCRRLQGLLPAFEATASLALGVKPSPLRLPSNDIGPDARGLAGDCTRVGSTQLEMRLKLQADSLVRLSL